MSSAFPNEPSGSSQILNWPFNSVTTSGGYDRMWDIYGSVNIMPDGSAPLSPANCMRSRMEAGNTYGGSQVEYDMSTIYNDLFVGLWWRTNSQFFGRTTANKMFFVRGPAVNGFFGIGGSQAGPYYLYFGHNTASLDNSHTMAGDLGLIGYPNVNTVLVERGTWAKIEVYIKKSTTSTSRDGIVRWWVNGILTGNYTNVNYAPNGLNAWVWSETWDGTVTNPIPSNPQEHWIDHLYISTGGVVTPSPSAPVIYSFTPTSGPTGTPITIAGANFDPNPAGNAITLNGIACATLGAQPTQLNTAVPNNGTTGQIRVTTSAGTTLSSTNFTVTTPTPGGGDGGGTGGGAGTTTGTFTTDFSGTQGPRWYYLNQDGSQMTYSSGSALWQGAQLYQGIWNGGFHPGSSSAAVLKYVVPGTGSVRITGTFADADTGGGNGVVCTIKKNGNTVTGGGPFTITNGNTIGSAYDISDSVTDGDYFTFEVASSGDNSFDSTTLNPAVVYTPQSQTEETITLTLTSLSITQDTTGVITLTISPTRATESIVTLTSSNASAIVPETVTIAANTSSTTVQVLAGTPGTATVTATLGNSTTSSTVTSVEAPPEPDPDDPIPASPTLSAYTDFLIAYRWF